MAYYNHKNEVTGNTGVSFVSQELAVTQCALMDAGGNRNCFNCKSCFNCNNCTDCRECNRCDFCCSCFGCDDCTRCYNLSGGYREFNHSGD